MERVVSVRKARLAAAEGRGEAGAQGAVELGEGSVLKGAEGAWWTTPGPLGLASWILFHARWKCRKLDFPLNKLSAGGGGEGLPKGWARG